MDREDVIEHLVGKYREVLEEKDDEELLGTADLEIAMDTAISEKVERYREHLEELDHKELLAGQRYQHELEGMTDEELEKKDA